MISIAHRFAPCLSLLTGAVSLVEWTSAKTNKTRPPAFFTAAVYLHFCERHKLIGTATFGPAIEPTSRARLNGCRCGNRKWLASPEKRLSGIWELMTRQTKEACCLARTFAGGAAELQAASRQSGRGFKGRAEPADQNPSHQEKGY